MDKLFTFFSLLLMFVAIIDAFIGKWITAGIVFVCALFFLVLSEKTARGKNRKIKY